MDFRKRSGLCPVAMNTASIISFVERARRLNPAVAEATQARMLTPDMITQRQVAASNSPAQQQRQAEIRATTQQYRRVRECA
jgi:hypothetical protein